MEMVACECDGLPPHDHYMGQALQDWNGMEVMGPVWDPEDIGRVWIPWKKLARALIVAEDASKPRH